MNLSFKLSAQATCRDLRGLMEAPIGTDVGPHILFLFSNV